jgi:hypothetical protein
MPFALSPFSLCIYQVGDVACPSTGYTQKSLVYTGFTDDRGCSACGCDPTACTGGNVTVSPNATCGGGVPNAVPVACRFDGIPPTFPYSAQITTAPTAGTCNPTGGQPGGAAVPTGATTVCCLPPPTG